MATVTLTPNANSAVNSSGWPDNGPADYTRMLTNDGDTTNIYTPTANSTVTYPTNGAGLTTETVNSVAVSAYFRPLDPNVDATTQMVLYIGGTIYTSPTQTINTPTPSVYSLLTYTWATNPATGTAWTIAALSGMEIGIRKVNTVGERCTQIYAVVDYSAGVTVTYRYMPYKPPFMR
jgi:hypothetical protein